MPNEEDSYALTPEGREIAEKALEFYAQGWDINEIGDFFELDPMALRVLVAMYGAQQ